MVRKARFLISSIAILACVSPVAWGASDKPFHVEAAASYAHQTSEDVTIGAKSFDNEDLTTEAFGKKTDLLRYGVVPVLVVIENKRGKTIDLRSIEVNLVASDGRHTKAVNPDDIPYLAHKTKQPGLGPKTVPIPLPKKKNPLNAPEIAGRAFSAQMLPPGDSASGFFYFEASPEKGDKLYLNGMKDTPNGQQLLYFEFPL